MWPVQVSRCSQACTAYLKIVPRPSLRKENAKWWQKPSRLVHPGAQFLQDQQILNDTARSPTRSSEDFRLSGVSVSVTKSLGVERRGSTPSVGTPLGGDPVGDCWGPAIRFAQTQDRAGTGPERREARPLGLSKRVFTIITPRLSPAALSPLSSKGWKRATQWDRFSVSPVRGKAKGQSLTATLAPPRCGPSSSLLTEWKGGSVRASLASTAAPACPSPSAAWSHWSLAAAPTWAKARVSLVPAWEAGPESSRAGSVSGLSGHLSGLRWRTERRRWCRPCVTCVVPADGPAGGSPGASPWHVLPCRGGPGRCARVAAGPALGE